MVINVRTFLVRFCLTCIYCLSNLITLPVYSIDTLYSLDLENNTGSQAGPVSGKPAGSIINVHLDNTRIINLDKDEVIDVLLPGGKIVRGRVVTLINNHGPFRGTTVQSTIRRKIVSLGNNAGSVEFDLVDNVVTRMLLHNVLESKIYLADIDSNGDGTLRVQDNSNYYCVKFPETVALPAIPQLSPQVAAAVPDVATLRNLQSRPGSTNVLFIDYWGGSLTGSTWNANYNSNNPINYTAYDTDGNPGSFSSNERYSMWLAWREAVEDFAPFNINITTSRAVYNAAAVTSRSQMIVTTTSSWYGNAGGVAYVNIFDDNSDYYKVGWTWNLSDRSMGMTISHEAGHQMGLRHDGFGGAHYYSGHGVWGPIMGAPFGKPYVQWSKGEYPNANQFEDDVAKVTTKLGLIADEAGDGFAGSTPLAIPVNNRVGLIGFGDTDTYKFTLGAASLVDIEVISLLGDENVSSAANLSIDVSLVKLNAGGSVISTISSINSADNMPLSPLTNEFAYSGILGSGHYGLRITPGSPDTNWATGFGSYGIAGEYRFTVNATAQNAPDLVVQPVSVDVNSLTPGQNFTISATVKNQGDASAGTSTLRYYRSTDSTISTSDTQLTTDPVPALAANGSRIENAAVPAPDAPGNYWVGACVDNVINESDTQNNCSAAVQITVTPATAPDLVVNLVILSSNSVKPGQDFNISASTLNRGSAQSSSTLLRYFISTNSTISIADTQLGSDNINSLNPNSASTQNIRVSAPVTLGVYWVGACVDSVANEPNPTNNCSVGSQIDVTTTPAKSPADECTVFVIPIKDNKTVVFCL